MANRFVGKIIQHYYCPMCKKVVPIKIVEISNNLENKYYCKICGCETSKV